MVYTIGKCSHWPLLAKVEIKLPSTISLRLCDVPGFGSSSQDLFRQKLVNDALSGLECSSIIFCLTKVCARERG